MKTTIKLLGILFLCAFTFSVNAQDAVEEISSEDFSEHLDLEAMASLFGDSDNLELFEKSLNDPENQISNLDLNGDEQVDYLRVMESAEDDTHLVAVQAVVGEDEYQDVATIEVEKDREDDIHVQVVGDPYIYGPNYIIEPVYVYRPSIFSIFWRPRYRPYRSVYYWGYYPRWYSFWRPHPVRHYHNHIAVHVNRRHTFHRVHVRRSHRAVALHTSIRRNDFAKRHPHRAYTARSVAVRNGNGTRARAAGVNQTNGTKRRAAGVNHANGTKRRAAGVNRADGTKVRAAGVNRADGTKKRVVTKRNPDGSRSTVAVRKNPNGSKRAIAVKKDANGNRKVKTAGRRGNSAKARKARRSKRKR